MPSQQTKRPGGRSAQVRAHVQAALEVLVTEVGRDCVTVPAVAERAGVSASSIYRRWGDLSGLMADTAIQRLDPQRPLPDKGELRQDLIAWAHEFIVHVAQPRHTSLLKAAAALASGEETDCLRNRKTEASTLVQRAQARGEPSPTAQQVVDHVVAPVILRLLFGATPVTPALATQLVSELLQLCPPTEGTSYQKCARDKEG